MTIIWFLILLGPLVFLHELGHFLTAKAFNVKVTAFSLGFGPSLWKRKWGETEYRLSLVPLGGYVSMIGEDPNEPISEEDKKRTLASLSLGKKILVVAAGPIVNFIVPIFLFFSYFITVDKVLPAQMGTVLPGMPAYVAGMRSGDKVVSVDGTKVQSFDQFRRIVSDSPGEKLNLKVERPGKGIISLTVTPASSVGRNAVGLMTRIGKAGVLLNGTRPSIGLIDTSSAAYKAGFRTGDLITGIEAAGKFQPLRFWPEYEAFLAKAPAGEMKVFVIRASGTLDELTGLSQGALEMISIKGLDDLKGIEKGELFVSDTGDGPAKRWGIMPGDRLWSIRPMKSGEKPGQCLPSKDSIQSMSEFEEVLARNVQSRLCVSWVSPSNGGSCFHSAAIKLDIISNVDQLGTKQKRYDLGLNVWRKMDMPAEVPVKSRFTYALKESVITTWELSKGMVMGIWYMITGSLDRENVGSVVMIAQMAKMAAEQGFFFFIQIMALISLNFALLNLLPIPVLDGGHILLFIVEAIMRRPLSLNVRAAVTWAGLGFILLLMVFGFKNDLTRVFRDKGQNTTKRNTHTGSEAAAENLSPIPEGALGCIKPADVQGK
ncbi:site-2 protease family protein [Myxococcota bacterium]|nr:site-2 protease family protein [Myxococcota bacterium]MBU1379182.1 site-2 protease family protein [Myxococcota bacterium]MBU1497502.1 site-2 protease family protein [Myxococcota bacterium]